MERRADYRSGAAARLRTPPEGGGIQPALNHNHHIAMRRKLGRWLDVLVMQKMLAE